MRSPTFSDLFLSRVQVKRLDSLVKLFQKEYGDDIVIYCSSIDFRF
ncbi:hypothetical protein [Hoylesella nanceiensis]|nr:hypothetical protein [Hoylesella nanceiensis]MBF1420454.1 hypothetical protein [Hoylesella nanceiensis]